MTEKGVILRRQCLPPTVILRRRDPSPAAQDDRWGYVILRRRSRRRIWAGGNQRFFFHLPIVLRAKPSWPGGGEEASRRGRGEREENTGVSFVMCQARISHQLPAAAEDLPVIAALLPATPPATSWSRTHPDRHLHALAMKVGEQCRLALVAGNLSRVESGGIM